MLHVFWQINKAATTIRMKTCFIKNVLAHDCTHKCNRIENVSQHEINKFYIVHIVNKHLYTNTEIPHSLQCHEMYILVLKKMSKITQMV